MAKAKYTYLYNGKEVRNSNKVYKYALINTNNKAVACSINAQSLAKQKEQAIISRKNALAYLEKNGNETNIANAKECLEEAEKWFIAELEVKEI